MILQAEQKLLAAKAQLNEAKQHAVDLNSANLGTAGGKRNAVKVEKKDAPSAADKDKKGAKKKDGPPSPKLGFFGKRREEKDKKKGK